MEIKEIDMAHLEYSGAIPIHTLPLMHSNTSKVFFVDYGNSSLVAHPRNPKKPRVHASHSRNQLSYSGSIVSQSSANIAFSGIKTLVRQPKPQWFYFSIH
jgi:hypothetical protein